MANDGIGAGRSPQGGQALHHRQGPLYRRHPHAGMTHAQFVRSPHAHARIKSIDTAEAAKAPGVHGVLTGADLADDRIGGLICGWMINSKDGSPMNAGAHPAIAKDVARYVGDIVAVVVADTRDQARDAAELVNVEYEELPAVIDPAKAQDPSVAADPSRGAEQPDLPLGPRQRGRDQGGAGQGQARHAARYRQQPADSLRHRAAGRHRRIRSRRGAVHALQHHPESACGAAGAVGLRRHRARAQAAGGGARRRRRLRLQDLHLCRGDDLPVGLEAGRRQCR